MASRRSATGSRNGSIAASVSIDIHVWMYVPLHVTSTRPIGTPGSSRCSAAPKKYPQAEKSLAASGVQGRHVPLNASTGTIEVLFRTFSNRTSG